MMLKIAITTLIALTSTVSATSIFSTRSGLQIAEARRNAIAENLANPDLVSTQWPAPSISYLRMPPLLDSRRLPLGDKSVLSQKQIDNILAIQATLNLDPERTGAEFTDFERGVGVALTQIAPNGMEGMMLVLGFVFSRERAHAILNAIIDAD